jgi:4-amino-4-deoxy-L-arabinose transferase-like glycosyltransferase
VPFTSKLLYHWDSVQFALALDKYDITVHQPHPPGYFLYVMLGRLLHLFISDANTVFVSISVIFSGLTVVTIYYLGKEIYDRKIGILAALIALTSPNLWFHGEVALTYIVEAFFSSAVALLCWRILKGEHKYIWLSVIALGIAGGIRQNTIVFLFPLWLFSVKGVPLRKIIPSLGLLGIVCLLWFIPMVWMTGGWNAYHSAFRDLWLFNTGHVSVFEKGWWSFKIFASSILKFVIYGIGAGVFILSLAIYSLARHDKFKSIDRSKIFFCSLWILPSFLFYLLIFIHPANPGYILIFLPALFILIASSIMYVSLELKHRIKRDTSKPIVIIMMISNIFLFFFTKYPVSEVVIRNHDNNLSAMLTVIKILNSEDTVLLVDGDIFFCYRHIMYYLPEFMVLQPGIKRAQTGEMRKTFFGIHGGTYLSYAVILPKEIKKFGILIIGDNYKKFNFDKIKGITIKHLLSFVDIALGPIDHLKEVYPELEIRLTNNIKVEYE